MQKLELSQEEWSKAWAIARALAPNVDRNEVAKVLTYLRRQRGRRGGKARFLRLLERLPNSGYIRSRRTRGYFEQIRDVCRRELADLPEDRAVLVLGWAFRLMTYHKRR